MKKEVHNYKTWLSIIAFSIFLLTIGWLLIGSKERVQFDYLVVLTFAINIVVFNWQLINAVKSHTFSLDMMYWFFSLFFFGYAPLLQFLTNVSFWNIKSTPQEFVTTNIYISIWSFCYVCGKKYLRRPKRKERRPFSATASSQLKQDYDYSFRNETLWLFVILSVVSTFYFTATIGFSNMIFRSTNYDDSLGTMEYLLCEHVLKNLIFYTFVLCLLQYKQTKLIRLELLISAGCFFVSCFPTGLSRNAMAAFYGGLIIITIKSTRQGRWFSFALIASLIFLFPAMDVFRDSNDFNNSNAWELFENEFNTTYLTGDYDAYTMFIGVQQYVKQFDFSFGKQLLGALLFFVPRSIWSSKPTGTGHMIARELLHNSFTNVSAPLVGEFFINFGVVGIICFGLLLGALSRKFDEKYWATDHPLESLKIIYPVAMFQFFFLQRGDLMSSFAYLVGKIVMGFVLCFFVIKKLPKTDDVAPEICKYIKKH